MGIDVQQWRAKIGLWHAFTTGRPLLRRRRCKPFRGISVRRQECKRAFKARQKRRQKTSVRCQFLPFVVVLTLFVVVDSRINTLNNLSCQFTSTRFYPAIRLAATLFLVGSNKYGSMDKRRNAGMEPRSLISKNSVMTVFAMLLILAGDVELNPGPSKLEASTDLAFLCSLPLAAEWRNLGTRLHLAEHQLNTIQANHAHSPNHSQDCLNSTFVFWLNNCDQPTCEFLIQAVDAMGRRDVVIMLCQKYRIVPPGALQSGGYSVDAHLQQPQSGYQPTPGPSQKLHQQDHSEFPSVKQDPEEKNMAIRSKYANTLKDKYRLNVPNFLTLQWPPPPTLKVFNLAMISQGELRYGADDELVRLLLRGKVRDVVSQKNEVTLEQISDSLHCKGRKVILIEGAPGAGKSTLAWHLCKMWEAGKLFQEFEIVLFVQLREPAIHSAKSLEDLLLAETLSTKEVISAIQYCGGHQVLIVLDSWDEFPPGLDEKFIIGELICNPSKLDMQFSPVIITSRPVATAQLLRQRLTTTRIEIVGFLRTEIQRYFTEAIGDSQIVKKLNDHLTQRPVIEASCYLPLNTAIVTHLFLALGHTLPTTLHGVFTSLVICCIIRHMKKQGKNIKISSLDKLPLDIHKQFNNLCTLAYHGVMENKATFSEDDLQSFKPPTELSTLSLMQGVASLTAFGESRLYNFLHLSTQELLAAYFITKMQPEEQVKVFNELFEQPRFANVFNFYAGFTKLKTAGIQDTVTSIVKSKNKILILSLLHCLYEAQDDKLCQFVSSQLEAELDLTNQTLSPVDCLSVGYTARSVCSTTAGRFKLKLTTTRFDEYGTKLMLKELSKYSTPSVLETAAKTKELQNLHLELYGERSTSSFAEQATVISKLGQYLRVLNLRGNNIGNAGAESLRTALKECTKLEYLNLASNAISDSGCIKLCEVLQKCTELQELRLGENQISDSGCITLCDALWHGRELQVLYLENNRISDSGCIKLCDGLIEYRNLQELYLYGNRISDSSIPTLTEFMKSAKSLNTLYLDVNEFTEEGKTQLREAATERNHYPDFVELDLIVYY